MVVEVDTDVGGVSGGLSVVPGDDLAALPRCELPGGADLGLLALPGSVGSRSRSPPAHGSLGATEQRPTPGVVTVGNSGPVVAGIVNLVSLWTPRAGHTLRS